MTNTKLIELAKRLQGPNGPWKSRDSVIIYTKTLNEAAEAILTLIAQKETARNDALEGYVLVPMEPTEAMIKAWEKSKPYDGDYTDEKCATACWKDMVASAIGGKTPAQPAKEKV